MMIVFSKFIYSQTGYIESREGKAGDNVEISIYINNCIEIKNSVDIYLSYDSLAVAPIQGSVLLSDALSSANFSLNNDIVRDGQWITSISTVSSSGFACTGNDVIAHFTFKLIGNLGEISKLEFRLPYDFMIDGTPVFSYKGQIRITEDECDAHVTEDICTQVGKWYCYWDNGICQKKDWYLNISTDNTTDESIINDTTLKLGMCKDCNNGFKYGEDEYNPPSPSGDKYIDLHFTHFDWQNNIDINGVECDDVFFTTDLHPIFIPDSIHIWNISAQYSNIEEDSIKLIWSFDEIDFIYDIYIYVDELTYNMKELENISIHKDDLVYDSSGNSNVFIAIGGCASLGMDNWDCFGCKDHSSCNYDISFINDNGLCTYPQENYDCDGNCIAEIDCAGICDGNTELDECGVCGGSGSSGVCGCNDIASHCAGNENACDCSCNEYDCLGICGGSAIIDSCGICGGDGSTCTGCISELACNYNANAIIDGGNCWFPEENYDCDGNCIANIDCNGTCGGNIVLDECGNCGGDGFKQNCEDTNLCNDMDCKGECNGNSILDQCGVCDDDNSNNCGPDCTGVWGGNATYDICGVCDGNEVNDNNCACTNGTIRDCNGICGGDAATDVCGICAGDGSECLDCSAIPFGNAKIDECGVCCDGNTGIICGIPDGNCGCMGEYNAEVNEYPSYDFCGVCGGDRVDQDGDGYVDGNYDCNGSCQTDIDCNGTCGGPYKPTFPCIINNTVTCSPADCFEADLSINDIPIKFGINKVYPNPFNPIVNIDYNLSSLGMTILSIYNIKGNEVGKLINEYKPAGSHSIIWNGNDYPSGIYFIILITEYSITKEKIILLK